MSRLINVILVSYVGLVLINSLLLPPINFISIDNLLFPFALVAITYVFFKNKTFKWSLIIAAVSITTGLVSNYFVDGVSIQEVLWLLRVVKLLTVGWAVYYLIQNQLRIFKSLLFFTFIGFSIINALQLLEWEFILELYSSNQSNVDALKNSYLDGRIFGVSTNPNSNGLILALFGFYYFISEEKNKYYLLLICGVLVIMTQSRTAFIAFALTILGVLLIKFINKSRKYVYLFLLSFIGGFTLLINLKLTNLSSLFDGTAFTSNSVSTRFEIINKVIAINKSTPLFGKGKISNIPELIGGSIDNEFIYQYLEYGIIGLLILLLTVLFLTIISIRLNINSLGLILIMIICGLTNLTFSNLEVSAVFILLFSASFIAKKKIQTQD